jgi:hypothetical protein
MSWFKKIGKRIIHIGKDVGKAVVKEAAHEAKKVVDGANDFAKKKVIDPVEKTVELIDKGLKEVDKL